MERIPQSDLTALRERAARHAIEFCEELYPSGRLSRTGGYWIVDDQDIRISLSSGYFWSIANYSQKPKGDIITLWLRAKGFLIKPSARSILEKISAFPATPTLRDRLSAGSRFGGYKFRSSDSFRLGVESLTDWLDDKFPVRSDLHLVTSYDS
jgi:hypothetical protein